MEAECDRLGPDLYSHLCEQRENEWQVKREEEGQERARERERKKERQRYIERGSGGLRDERERGMNRERDGEGTGEEEGETRGGGCRDGGGERPLCGGRVR